VRQALGEKEKEKEKEKGRHNSDISSVAAYETAPLDERKVNLCVIFLVFCPPPPPVPFFCLRDFFARVLILMGFTISLFFFNE
jgi:hypothetical protein